MIVPGLHVVVGALTRGLRVLDAEAGRYLRIESGGGGRLRLLHGDRLVVEDEHVGTVLGHLVLEAEEEADRLLVGRSAFHAALAVGEHGGILLIGDSCSGKSTLVVALVENECVYGGEDVAVVQEDGTVLPYPRPIHLRPGALDLLGSLGDRFDRIAYDFKDGRHVEYLTPKLDATASLPVCVRVLAFLERRGSSFGTETLSQAEAVARLLSHSLGCGPLRQDMDRAARLVEGTQHRVVVSGGHPHEIAAALCSL